MNVSIHKVRCVTVLVFFFFFFFARLCLLLLIGINTSTALIAGTIPLTILYSDVVVVVTSGPEASPLHTLQILSDSHF